MPTRARQLALLIRKLEARITELEQERPPDSPVRLVANINEVGVETGLDSVTTTKKDDFLFQYDVPGQEYGVSEWAPANKALEFTQNDDVVMPDGYAGQTHTVTFWIRRTSEDESNYERIFRNGDGSTNSDGTGGRLPEIFLLNGDHSRLHYRFSTDVDGNDGVNTDAGGILLDETILISGVVDLSVPDITVYKNDANIIGSSALSSTTAGTGTSPVWLRNDGRTTEIFTLDDVRYYDRALSASEVSDIYNGIDVVTNLLAQWKFDGGAAATAMDSAGTNDGTITGATIVPGISP